MILPQRDNARRRKTPPPKEHKALRGYKPRTYWHDGFRAVVHQRMDHKKPWSEKNREFVWSSRACNERSEALTLAYEWIRSHTKAKVLKAKAVLAKEVFSHVSKGANS